jgi:hypothetical protein
LPGGICVKFRCDFCVQKSSNHATYGFLVADDDELACIFENCEAAAANFGQKDIPANIAFHVAHLSADHAAISCGL